MGLQLYGNYLYEKKRAYDAAIQQYCHTIGYLDPSYVISRFLDAQRIKNLTTYLEVSDVTGRHVMHACSLSSTAEEQQRGSRV